MNINWKDWDLVMSASQIETWDSCRRKWWFSKPQKMPELDKGFQIYGNVIHSVADRFFAADDLGYDVKTKKPVNLFPDGWEISCDRTNPKKVLGTVTPQEQAQIKLLVKRAIEEGIWVRMPGREAEASFFRKVSDRIAIIGYIDLLLPDEVVDHKSTKNMRYAKSGEDLLTNTQMLVYAWECNERAKEKGLKIDGVNARHNIFSKDPKNPVVKAVVTPRKITLAEIEAFWVTVKERAVEMRKLKRAGIAQENWSAVKGPDDKATCEAYGGCAFQGICNKRETPIQYRARIELAQKGQQEGASTLTTGTTTMGLFDKLKTTATAAPAKSAPPSMPKPPPELQTQKAAAAAPAPTKEQLDNKGLHPNQEKAPWAREGCKGCKGLGITKNGTACRVCDTLNKKDGKPTSSSWTLAVSDDGRITWTDAAGTQGSTPAVADVKVTDKTTAPTSAPAPAQEQSGGGALKGRKGRKPKGEAAPAATEQEQSSAEISEQHAADITLAEEKGKPGRPKSGFTLLVGCLPERGKQTGIINLDQVFADMGAELAKEMGCESYFALDGYKRRDWLAMRARQISDTFESKTVTAIGESPDFREFLAAIKPYAAYVYVGVA